MKPIAWLFLGFVLCLAAAVRAQTAGSTYSDGQLDELLGPIALYPDPLLALILPASTVPTDVALAAHYLSANGQTAGIDAQPWDPSVKALARYPDVIRWMNENLAWTESLGAAFARQPTEVMQSVQQLRAQARAAGTLVNTPQQQIDLVGDSIRIVPAQTDLIYVPAYDPSLVYEDSTGYSGSFLTFGTGYRTGVWLGYQCNWDDFGIWVGPWNHNWAYDREWRNPHHDGNPGRAWGPDPRRSREVVRNFYRPDNGLPRTHVMNSYRAPTRANSAGSHPMVVRTSPSPDFRGRTTTISRPVNPTRASPLLGGYSRGAATRDFSGRGQNSRNAPVRAPAPGRNVAPGRNAAPAHNAAPAQAPAHSEPNDKRDRH